MSREKYRALLASASKTAGSDNWKTSAGRVNGPDGFVAGDAWRLLKIHFKSTSKPSVCPVCMDKPSDEDWYITKSCKHAVCRDCLQNYALSLISDETHTGPLKCPCCPRLLRVEDAKVALDKVHVMKESVPSKRAVIPKIKRSVSKSKLQQRGGLFADEDNNNINENASSALELLEKWDNKTKDQLLRSMKDFRPCPHCSEGVKRTDDGSSLPTNTNLQSETSNQKGGGFVTPECLAPINEERESNAEIYARMAGPPSAKAVLIGYCLYYLLCGSTQFNNSLIQLMAAILPSVLLPILPHVIRLCLANMARREIMRPIIVTCPCCNRDFNLDASSELALPDSSSDSAAEAATQRWKNTNTRPCPGCSSPIMKDGGCNHVRCGRCKADFCWGCMRTRSGCRAYQCRNGAPYGNAFGDGSMAAVREGLNALERERQGRSLVERIDYIESEAMRQLRHFRSFPWRFAALVGIVGFAVSELTNASRIARSIISGTLSLANTVIFSFMLIVFVVIVNFIILLQAIRPGRHNGRNNRNNNGRAGGDGAMRWQQRDELHRANNSRRRSMSFRRQRFMTEEEQLAEAIARSLADQ